MKLLVMLIVLTKNMILFVHTEKENGSIFEIIRASTLMDYKIIIGIACLLFRNGVNYSRGGSYRMNKASFLRPGRPSNFLTYLKIRMK